MANKRPLPPTYLFSTIVVMVLLHFLLPIAEVVPYPWQLLGGVPLLFGITLNLIADQAFKKNHTTVKPFEESSTLITTGVFQLSRHPMHLGMVFILAGIGILMGTLMPFLVIPVFALLIDVVFVRTEERMLADKFGERWQKYQAKVRRWI
jgi:protein-S-isoprenylcysteine O-methyltransferase Ste14